MVNTVQWSALILSSPYDRPLTSYYKKYSSDAKFLGKLTLQAAYFAEIGRLS
jgi:hypothetical protein